MLTIKEKRAIELLSNGHLYSEKELKMQGVSSVTMKRLELKGWVKKNLIEGWKLIRPAGDET